MGRRIAAVVNDPQGRDEVGEFDYDLIFAGCGLASGLSAYLIRKERPTARILVLDAGRPADWDQTWSFQTLPGQLDETTNGVFRAPDASWLAPFLSGYWPRYEVQFPGLQRVLNLPYASLRYSDFIKQLAPCLGSNYRRDVWISTVEPQKVTLQDGKVLRARCVVDARGWEAGSSTADSGFQKFVGLHLQLKKPHGLQHPILMDATVPQNDGFRFMYVLPWTDSTLLIEDTHYSRQPDLDPDFYQQEILHYARQKAWIVDHVIGSEQGALPIPYYGQERPVTGPTPTIGVKAGLFHPTTGYSIYEAVLIAEWLAQQAPWEAAPIQKKLVQFASERWRQHEFYRRLNNMLFFASADDQRYRILEKFYEHEENLVARFYSGQTSARDKLAILSGKPPVPVRKGIYHFFHRVGVGRGTA
ncbi:MAG TPA: lycopene beta-cyclase CrtY [Oligoflexus sp.]|uniref:lycopene beta-cyclase CrtY n=1 Tax=Oligoflexus sp. TaxID=1971216 RepID=UPI002D3D01B8|nr:lycopene beta-cyclase CrtY [Oligoflexus sp.]HYX39721.1 lycopene beta-cyclase CrtY [Oligoflexus sp.]